MNVFELLGTIAIDASGANKTIEGTAKNAKTMQAKMGAAFTRIGKDAIACGKAIAKGMAVVTAAGTAITAALVKTSVNAYAEFEQLEGGVKKLFGEENMGKVIDNAKKAFQTAGMSMNDYLSTSTRLSASLISDLGGDQVAAAEIIDMAIRDMSDNANTYGQDIERIKDAYGGIMRGEYSMLDNLSLGYQGNKSEMARLINDSKVLGENFKATAENLDKISLAKQFEAIHVMQSMLGIAGTTEAEAKDTIAGSFTMLKASWENLVTSMGDDENMEPFVDAFFDAGNKVLMNLAKVLPKIGRNVKAAMERAGVYIHQAWEQNIWPTIQKFVIKFGIELPDWSVIDGSLTSWWSGTGQPAVENIKAFFADIAAWVAEHKEEINGFLFALGGTLLLLNAPLALIIGGLLLVAANWKKIKTAVTNAMDAIDKFFSQTIPDAWKSMVEDVKEWWGKNVETPINNALNLLKEFFNQPSLKEVVLRITTIQSAGGDLGDSINNDPSAYDPTWQEFLDSGGLTYDDPAGPPLPPGHASGLRNVPEDNYLARLHLGETVLPRNEAEEYRNGKTGSADIAELKSEVVALRDMVSTMMQQLINNTAAGHQVVLESGRLVGALTPQIDAQLGVIAARKQRRG